MTKEGRLMVDESIDDMKELPNKGERARNNLGALAEEAGVVGKKLKSIQSLLEHWVSNSEKGEPNTKKKRSMFTEIPNRIEFKLHGFLFYIDFSMSIGKDSGPEVEGIIVYGTSRSLCFAECLYPKKGAKNETCKFCERIARCDNLEDKPLLRFTIDRHGRIVSTELDDEWWVLDTRKDEKEHKETQKKNTKNIGDLHYRAIDRIWGDAVDWTNENILP
jgi:hypothetical protein